MQTVLIHLFGYSIFLFRKLKSNELKVVVRECQLPMLLILQHIHNETQKHVIGVFPSAKCNETLHIIDGTYLKCIMIPFISDALDWCCSDGCHKLMRVSCSCPMNKQKEKFNKKGCATRA